MSHDTTPGLQAEPAERPHVESMTQAGAREPDPLLALVRAAASGQRESLVRLLSLVAPPISATVRIFLARDPSEMEDVVQEVLIAVTKSLPRFRADSSFLHYCRRIAVRMALAHRRARRQRAETAISPLDMVQPSPASVDGIEREQRLAAFRQLLDELPSDQAESLAYRVVLEYPLPVIARETGVPINTVRSRIRLARNYLRDRISSDPGLTELLRDVT
jgi:RNA polymerase sigma factor (sigma-70 family)